jgi:hypothetical protein
MWMIKEAIETELHTNMNKEDGLSLSRSLKPLIHSLSDVGRIQVLVLTWPLGQHTILAQATSVFPLAEFYVI